MVPRRGSAPWFRFRGSALPNVGTAAPEAPHGAPPPACRCARSDIWEIAGRRQHVAGTEPRACRARNHAPHRRSTRRRGSAFPNVGPAAPEAPHGGPPTGVSLCPLRHLGNRGAPKTRRRARNHASARHGTTAPHRHFTRCRGSAVPVPWFWRRGSVFPVPGFRGSAFPNVGPVAPEAPHGAPPPACRHARSDIWEGAGRRKRVAGTEPRACAATEPCAGGPRRTRRARKRVCRRREMAAGRRLGSCLMP